MERGAFAWLRGLGTFEWASNDQPYAKLLEELVRDRTEDEMVVHEMEATSRVDVGELRHGEERAADQDLDRAQSEVGTFRTALEDAWARRSLGEVPYDNHNPVENAQVDALIQYVVRPGYAEVATEELEPGHYIYRVKVDWPRLRALAEAGGHPLPL